MTSSSNKPNLLRWTLAGLTTAVLLLLLKFVFLTPGIDLVVTLESSAPTNEVVTYVNQVLIAPQLAFNTAGLKTYRFKTLPAKIDVIEIDINENKSERITLHSIELQYSRFYLLQPSGVLFKFNIEDWMQWFYWGFKPQPEAPGVLSATSGYNRVQLLPKIDLTDKLSPWSPTAAVVVWAWVVVLFAALARFVQRTVRPDPAKRRVLLLLAAAFGLRIVGVAWGLPSANSAVIPFADESFSVAILQSVFRGELVTEGYREGSLIYLIWWLVVALLHLGGLVDTLPSFLSAYNDDYGRIILVCRAVNVVLSTGSVLLLYLSVRMITGRERSAFWAAVFFAVLPFEIIFSRLMRTHIPGNFFLSLALYLALRMRERSSFTRISVAGIGSGLAMAVRYNLVFTAGIPLFYLLCGGAAGFSDFVKNCGRKYKEIIVLAAAHAAAFVLVNSGYVIAHEEVAFKLGKMQQFVSANEFRGWELLNMKNLYLYLSYLIPIAFRPLLWVPVYALALLSLFHAKHRWAVFPLFVFCFIYLYSMSKGYPYGFLRATVGVYPLFAVLAAVGMDFLLEFSGRRRTTAAAVQAATAGICIASAMYAAVYSLALTTPSTRQELFEWLASRKPEDKPLEVAIVEKGSWFDSVYPVVAMYGGFKYHTLRDEKDFAASTATYLILPELWTERDGDIDSIAQGLQASHNLTIVEVVERPVKLFGLPLFTRNDPFDLNYPFPKFIVMERRVQRAE